ncbi:MAG TPA: bifunctional adenosylcobinamide kinase/adenosylcobinamide-phosphate guanylyltransferase [Actinomycetales bacterium]
MRVDLLGTGSADGWPNAFCGCASCRTASATGRLRVPTSALVDGTLLLDCGPETPRAALRHGDGLAAVTHVLVTHDHPDHSAPMALLARDWAGRREPLTVVGPPSVVDAWSRWVGPSSPVVLVAVRPGDEADAGPHRVRVLEAAHGHDAVLYDVTGPDGSRLLYATDTGRLPAATRAAVRGAAFDVVLLEATFGDRHGPGRPAGTDHLDLDAFAAELGALRAAGAVTDRTDVVAVHLSHQSPPDLEARLARWGARVVDDGTRLVVGSASPAAPPRPHRTLVLGGARSGKSTVAERLLAAEPVVTYLATGPVPGPDDHEWAARVELHRTRRPASWTTVETADPAAALRAAGEPVLLDCLGTWLTGVLDRADAWDDAPGWRERVEQQVDGLVEAWHAAPVPVVAVSNEVGSGVVPATASGRVFRELLGRLNTRVADASERVVLVVAGREIDLTRSGTHLEDHR